MKCPQCGTELHGTTKCSTCGKKGIPLQDIEVEYKEFPVSELLEIRKKHPSSELNESEASEIDNSKKQLPDRGKPVLQKQGNRFFLIPLLVFLFVVFLAGAYYFLHFLFRNHK
jgi:hypothetical protein